jgi:hypothetical protein
VDKPLLDVAEEDPPKSVCFRSLPRSDSIEPIERQISPAEQRTLGMTIARSEASRGFHLRNQPALTEVEGFQ